MRPMRPMHYMRYMRHTGALPCVTRVTCVTQVLFQLDEEQDINLARDFFSYNHFCSRRGSRTPAGRYLPLQLAVTAGGYLPLQLADCAIPYADPTQSN